MKSDRPIAARGIEGIEELYEKRRPLYLKYADFVTDANGYGAAEKAETIIAAWREFSANGRPGGERSRTGEGPSRRNPGNRQAADKTRKTDGTKER